LSEPVSIGEFVEISITFIKADEILLPGKALISAGIMVSQKQRFVTITHLLHAPKLKSIQQT
jgi:hypothetical protein